MSELRAASIDELVMDERTLCNALPLCSNSPQATANLCHSRASDIMTPSVQNVSANWSIGTLAKFFIAQNISGAPVVDDDDTVIGVVSATDILEFENISFRERLAITRSAFYQEFVGQQVTEQDLEQLSAHPEDCCTTESIMTPDIISVNLDASIPAIARLMSRRHIHRVFVSDGKQLVGVISTTDVLKAIGDACKHF